MTSMAVRKSCGWALIIGIVSAFLFFYLQPGGLLISPASPTDPVASITAFASNNGITVPTSLLISFGLVISLYGFYALQRMLRDNSFGDSIDQYGINVLAIGYTAWIFTQGLILVMSATPLDDPDALKVSVTVHAVRTGLLIMGTFAVALGMLLFSMGLAVRNAFNRVVSLIVALVSLLVIALLVFGLSSPAQLQDMITYSRYLYLVWAAWNVFLGIIVLRGADEHLISQN